MSSGELAAITALLEVLAKVGALGALVFLLWLNGKRDKAQTEAWTKAFSALASVQRSKHTNGHADGS